MSIYTLIDDYGQIHVEVEKYEGLEDAPMAVVLYHSQSSNQRPVDKNVKNNPNKDGEGGTYNY